MKLAIQIGNDPSSLKPLIVDGHTQTFDLAALHYPLDSSRLRGTEVDLPPFAELESRFESFMIQLRSPSGWHDSGLSSWNDLAYAQAEGRHIARELGCEYRIRSAKVVDTGSELDPAIWLTPHADPRFNQELYQVHLRLPSQWTDRMEFESTDLAVRLNLQNTRTSIVPIPIEHELPIGKRLEAYWQYYGVINGASYTERTTVIRATAGFFCPKKIGLD